MDLPFRTWPLTLIDDWSLMKDLCIDWLLHWSINSVDLALPWWLPLGCGFFQPIGFGFKSQRAIRKFKSWLSSSMLRRIASEICCAINFTNILMHNSTKCSTRVELLGAPKKFTDTEQGGGWGGGEKTQPNLLRDLYLFIMQFGSEI